MFNGWLSFAGNEVLNQERVRAYAAELLPNFQMRTTCRDDELGLATMLGDSPYLTPLIDEAPWIDHDDPDTYGFCGAFPLSVTGLTDSGRAATVIENTADGGAVVGRRRKTKEVRVSALLMATSDGALAAGKRWLSAVLDGGCDPCEPAELCFLVGTNPDNVAMGDYVVSTLTASRLLGPTANWASGTGVFTPTTTTQAVTTPEAPYPLPCDEIIWHWNITSATAGTTIIIECLGESGVVTSQSYTLSANGGTFTVADRGTPQRRSYSRLRVTSAPGETVTIASVEMEYRADAAEDACFTKYARRLHRVTCIDGPTTVEEFSPSQGAMERVEFSFAAEMPHVYGLQQEVLSMEGGNVVTSVRDAEVFRLDKTVAACTLTSSWATSTIYDPLCPPVPSPPRSNVAPQSCAPDPPYLDSYALAIPDSMIPLWAEAVPVLSMTTGSLPAHKVQVRFMPRPFPSQAPSDLDPCSACGEFVIDYIPPNSTFTLNGIEERAYITKDGKVWEAGHLLSGMTSSTLFQWPVLTCGTGYLAIVDTTTEGVGRFDLSVAVRE